MPEGCMTRLAIQQQEKASSYFLKEYYVSWYKRMATWKVLSMLQIFDNEDYELELVGLDPEE